MKFLHTIIFTLVFFTAFGKKTTYENLVEINKCWTEQTDLSSLPVLATENYTDRDWIRTHLSLVENTLRNRSVEHLTATQKANRNLTLDRLHEYWQQGNFPVNDKYAFRTPIFIDDYNNFCAVGYLIKATGHENISRMITANTNLAYVREMNYPELSTWANDYGFTTGELAWIQPGYGPIADRVTEPIGKGTNGEVLELYVNAAGDKLYVGGSFTQVDSSVNASHIAYVTENGGVYTWHNLGTGVNGDVYAIQEFQGNVFVAGSFTMAGSTSATNVAYWDGSTWHAAGCTYGTVKDLIVHNNELYAVGDFDVCAAMSEVNIAKWNGSNMWGYMPGSNGLIQGHVNTVKEHNGYLLIGGSFSYLNNAVNIIKWSAGAGFETYNNGIENEVMDIGILNDSIYALCNRTSATDSNLILQLDNNNNWMSFPGVIDDYISQAGYAKQYNTFCAQGDTIMIGGEFYHYGMMGPVIQNCLNLYELPQGIGVPGNWFMVDDAINKMVVYKGDLIAGGKFKFGYNFWSNNPLNHITKKGYQISTKVKDVPRGTTRFKLYPNPSGSNTEVKIENLIAAKKYAIINMQGVTVHKATQSTALTEIKVPELASGTYIVEISNEKGDKGVQTLTVK